MDSCSNEEYKTWTQSVSEHLEKNKKKYTTNPYWENITKIAEKQREKGISEYGRGVEDFKDPCAIERIKYAEEELVDALMYLEWLKDCLGGKNE